MNVPVKIYVREFMRITENGDGKMENIIRWI